MFKSYSEIFDQGISLEKTYRYIIESEKKIKKFFSGNDFHDIVFIACGSSYWASLSASMNFSETFNRPCFALKSGELVLNSKYYKNLYDKPLIVAPSRSGSTSETLIAIDFFKKNYNSPILTMVGYKDSPLLKKSDCTLEMPWITEVSICQTQAFSCLYLACVLISALLNSNQQLIRELENYATGFHKISLVTEEKVKAIINSFTGFNTLYVLGNGKQYGVSIEASYINIEMAACHSGYYGTLEFRHGPIVMCDPNTLVAIISNGCNASYESELSREIRETGAKVLFISPDAYSIDAADYLFSYNSQVPEIIALYGVFVMQGLAYYKAISKGLNPDKPKNLVQWIKIEQK